MREWVLALLILALIGVLWGVVLWADGWPDDTATPSYGEAWRR